MDIARIEQLRDELLHNRKYAAIAGALALLFLVVSLAGGYLLFKSAMVEDRPVVSRSVTNVPTQFASLLSDKRGEVLNHIVFFNDVHLEPGPTEDVYYAVGAAGDRVLVVSQGKKALSNSDEVDVKGTVKSLPASSTLTKKWKLDKAEVKAIREQGIYIEADEIVARKAKSTPRNVAKK